MNRAGDGRWNASRRRADSPNRPNVLSIMADDLGMGDLTSHDHPYLRTPNIDRIRREGTEVTKGLQLAHAVCSPSRAGALTGPDLAQNGIEVLVRHGVLGSGHQSSTPSVIA